MTELSQEECDYLNAVAEQNGLCCNCFHTIECCGGECGSLVLDDPYDHDCRVG